MASEVKRMPSENGRWGWGLIKANNPDPPRSDVIVRNRQTRDSHASLSLQAATADPSEHEPRAVPCGIGSGVTALDLSPSADSVVQIHASLLTGGASQLRPALAAV